MNKSDVIKLIFPAGVQAESVKETGSAFAPTNIALCKYWGKRCRDLNLPLTSSLSIALPNKGANTRLSFHTQDKVILNGKKLTTDSQFVKRLTQFLDMFRAKNTWHLLVDIEMNIPVAAGLASSACGFAALVLALDDFFGWHLPKQHLSILARLGSGSASRSLWNGFVEWHAGQQVDGMDSYAEPLAVVWPNLRVGILPLSQKEKPISSREAMQRTVETSLLYQEWPKKVAQDMGYLKQALAEKDFTLLGSTAESNALNMHATMLSSWPPVCYFLPETVAAMQRIWQLRSEGCEIYFTQDAGPNLKLLFLEKDQMVVKSNFPEVDALAL
ncbi:MAG: diphosphomevalonate decarboxylase [Gammaproteobacteria bacterium]